MVITFLIVLIVVEIVIGVMLQASIRDDERSAMFFGWLLGAFTSATGYVLFYQMFPVG